MSVIAKTKDTMTRLNPFAAKYRFGGVQIQDMALPPTWGMDAYLQAYGELGWLFRGTSVIADAVARNKWSLYKVQNGDLDNREKVPKHVLLDTIKHVNPFMTWYELMYLQTCYMVLVGEQFLVFDMNNLGIPEQIWPIIPSRMMVIRDNPMDYISYYRYVYGGVQMRLEIPEVLHIKNPNPFNPLRGIGAAQALGTDLSIEKFSGRYQEKVYHNDAMPGVVYEVQGEIPPKEEREQIMGEFKREHAGWRNARKTAFAWGGAKVHTLAMTNKELDGWKEAQSRGAKILNVLGVPDVIAGKEGSYNRATAEVAREEFNRGTVLPYLTKYREAFNEQWLPLYKQNSGVELMLDFDDPVPENIEAKTEAANKALISGRISRNEARVMAGEDAIKDYDVFYVPNTITVIEVDDELKPIEPEEPEVEQPPEVPETPPEEEALPKAFKFFTTEDQKDAHWKQWVAKTEEKEKPLQEALQSMFKEQESRAMQAFHLGATVADIFDRKAADSALIDILNEYLPDVLSEAIADGENLVKPQPMKQKDPPIWGPNEDTMKWLQTRIVWAALEVGDETELLLRSALSAGVEAGEGAEEIAKRVKGAFEHCENNRALRIARTEVMTASNIGNEEGYKRAGVEKQEWYAALDERICELCEDLHGNVYKIGSGDRPPAHVNCLLPDVRVEAPLTEKAMRHWYDGESIEIITAGGNSLRTTPNHPILTNRGWIAANFIEEGDYVICHQFSGQMLIDNPNVKDAPSKISEIFDALADSFGIERVAGAYDQFHGDGSESDVDIISINSLLQNWLKSSFSQPISNKQFAFANHTPRLLSCSGEPSFCFKTGMCISPCFVGSRCHVDLLSSGQFSHAENIGFAARAWGDTLVSEYPADNIAGDAIGSSQGKLGFSCDITRNQIRGSSDNILAWRDATPLEQSIECGLPYAKLDQKFMDRFTGLITADKIISIRNFQFSGHVYDLQTESGWYTANASISHNGIIAKNCRCAMLPVVE